jgi:hypothetical protein
VTTALLAVSTGGSPNARLPRERRAAVSIVESLCRMSHAQQLTSRRRSRLPQFMDVHTSMVGVAAEQLAAAHQADLDIQGDEGVVFKQAWADPKSGHVFCLSEAPSAEAVQRIHERAGHLADEVHEITVAL